MSELDISNEMAKLDLKDRNFYESLSDEDKKQFSAYLMIRWGSCVQGDVDLQEYYIMACNQRLNKHFFALNKHPQLQWLCATTISPGMGKFKHNWIPVKKKESKSNNKIEKFLTKLYPSYKMDDIQILASLTTNAELKSLAKSTGMTPEQIKKEIG
jgi:hypothetical protein